ncbi:hypothetical protein [Demequina salsinemoris]|uniref:hypothetical protein n=1 Tax=Demequina salsinemoris TaxID=577470 RepID=UPI000785D8AD|nr:hypothetical protein [Demequina salsinemoris]
MAPLVAFAILCLSSWEVQNLLEPYPIADTWWFFIVVGLPALMIAFIPVDIVLTRAKEVWGFETSQPARSTAVLPLPLDGGYTDGWCVAFLAAPGRRLDALACLSDRGVEPSAAVDAAYETARPVVAAICMAENDARALAGELGAAGAMVAVIRGER